VSAAALSVSAFLVGQRSVGVLLLALACGCAGFLPHNWTPARIFMGDSGSLFIGFVISVSALFVCEGSRSGAIVAGPLMVTFVATVDTCVVLVSRRRAGRPLMLGGTDHVSHRLRRLGMRIPQVAMVLFAVAAVSSLLGVLVASGVLPAVKVLAGGTGTVATAVGLLLRVPVYGAKAKRIGADSAPPATGASAGPAEAVGADSGAGIVAVATDSGGARAVGARSGVGHRGARDEKSRVKAPPTRRRRVGAGRQS
jgi:UDP-GlcNAc:undecaprenyl-phosphate GlcNAc-1-phosphate transferase